MSIQTQCCNVSSRFLSEFTSLISGVCKLNDKKSEDDSSRTVFDCKTTKPSMPVVQYLLRLVKGARGTAELFTVMLIFINRLEQCAGIELTSRNCHRLLLTTFVIASKATEDFLFSNKYYAQIGGISLQDLNEMEVAFLNSTNWNTSTTVEYPLYAEKLSVSTASQRIP
eukprot:TRINITY_DN2898_c6_g1_i1.p1 TRINITY_DN2898_c6_g1~~TRINITY_DN2898_c6_g1_i1.p1  ORF type:complete len:184 (+),score=36.02 TRINITY_DN2898_c6_g1_i1:48-554(+)